MQSLILYYFFLLSQFYYLPHIVRRLLTLRRDLTCSWTRSSSHYCRPLSRTKRISFPVVREFYLQIWTDSFVVALKRPYSVFITLFFTHLINIGEYYANCNIQLPVLLNKNAKSILQHLIMTCFAADASVHYLIIITWMLQSAQFSSPMLDLLEMLNLSLN